MQNESKLPESKPSASTNGLAFAVIAHALILAGAIVYLGFQVQQLVKVQHSGTPMPAVRAEAGRPANAAPQAPVFDQSKFHARLDGDYIYGNKNASVSVIAYMDYECPFCTSFYPVAKQFVDQSEAKVNFVLRLFPLDFHPHANILATSALCVGQQKGSAGFYDFTDKMYAHGANFSGDVNALVADTVKPQHLDTGKFDKCLKDGASQNVLQTSVNEGKTIGVKGTPSMVLYDAQTKKAVFVFGTKTVAQLQDLVKTIN